MNITRFALSIALLFSVASASAESTCSHDCTHSSVSTDKVCSIDAVIAQATEDFNLTDAEATSLRTRLETDENADIAAIVAEIRTQISEATAEQKTAEVTELI